ncbi:U3 small nucleolar RNA-associated protein 14 homolog A-like [Paramacrobiotus metropolitanus]|uniref:U3 small nucleolar RNA-associated protein 14 homolog A-like n=1 Tax=Paramacrobiotus metropolitanus TaxID=2943436 RepID=UPI0024456CD1|nr:U3 small nucleolar RNA-associated protein 14 homolog A-like [Paramacrobiotus metropolitanus]
MASLLVPIHLDETDDNSAAYDSDEEPDKGSPAQLKGRQATKHDKLIKSISRLDKAPVSLRKIERTEAAAVISDQNLSGSSLRSVSIGALLKKSDRSAADEAVKKKLQKTKQSQLLSEPLKRHEAVKIERAVNYTEVSKDLGKWDKIVKNNRTAEGVVFPLNTTAIIPQTASEFVVRDHTKTPLEEQIEALLGTSKNNLTKSTVLTEAEREALQAMSLQEAEMRRQELQKHRALLSYKEQKARWQSKIKSKGYHRHLRRAKRKVEEREFEELKTTNPAAAAEKLLLLDKKRLQERLTLKHRGTGKWAKYMQQRAKTDKDAREALQEQLRLSRAITEKIAVDDEDDESDVEDIEPEDKETQAILDEEAAENPWMSATLGSAWEDNDLEQGFADAQGTEDRNARQPKPAVPPVKASPAHPVSTRGSRKRGGSPEKDDDDVVELSGGGELVSDTRNTATPNPSGVSAMSDTSATDFDVDPSKLLLASNAKVRKTVIPMAEDEEVDEVELEENDAQRDIIAEAFADDDVVADFSKKKKELEDTEKAKDIDLTLPGWGEWTGAGTKGIDPAKRKRFTIKAPRGPPRKDRFLQNVMISEKHDEKLVPHQVKELPFPFRTVEQFHGAIRMPVGKMWNTEAAFDEMTKPKFTTKMGGFIKPMPVHVASKKRKSGTLEETAKEDSLALSKSEVVRAKKQTVKKKRK